MKRITLPLGVVILAFAMSFLGSVLSSPVLHAQDWTDVDILTIDHFVSHISTVPANAGERVDLFVRERVQREDADEVNNSEKVQREDVDEGNNGGNHEKRPVVLMITGATQPAMVPFDLRFENYSWMAFLAQAGFDVFAMDLTGYGLSPRPQMDDPCNASDAQQKLLLIPNPLAVVCPHSYAFRLTTSQSDWDEIDTVVEYIRELRHVNKVSLVGWSLGGPRAGGYAARHADKVKRLLLYAPFYDRNEPTNPPDAIPEPDVPLMVRTVAAFFSNWDSQVQCTNQFDPAVREAVRATLLAFDPLGRTWGTPPDSLWRAPVQNTRWGWNPVYAALIEAPTLLIRGDLDTQVPVEQVRALYDDLIGVPDHKVFVHVACAAHQLVWENQHMILLRASAEWLRDGTFAEQRGGSYFVDVNGNVHPD
jgi:pimeloyl-ACP methyl ester carboxylesterase